MEIKFDRGRLLHDEACPEMEMLIAKLCRMTAWRAVSVSTGRKPPKKGAPITGFVDIQFVNVVTGQPAYCNFNVEPRRQRSRGRDKAGSYYKNPRQFWISENHALAKLMRACGIRLPNGTGDAWQYVTKLKNRMFTAPPPKGGEKLKNSLVFPLSMTFFSEEFRSPNSDKSQINLRLNSDKFQITFSDRKTPETVTPRDIQSVTTTERTQRSNTVNSKQYTDVASGDSLTWWQRFSMYIRRTIVPCEPTIDDLKFLATLLPQRWRRRHLMLLEYKQRWMAAMALEQKDHRKQNSGRYAANCWLRSVQGEPNHGK